MVIFSTLVKVAVQVELARWTISTGQPALTGYNKVPPKLGPMGWINLLWVLMALSKILQIGGIVGGGGRAFSILMPLGGDPLGGTSLTIWTIIVAVRQHRSALLEQLQPDRAGGRHPRRRLQRRHRS